MSILTAAQADKINRFNPTAQEVALGTSILETQTYAPVIIEYAVAADASSNVAAFTAPFAMRITLVTARCTAAITNGAIQPKKATTAMCTAITCAVDKVQTSWGAGIETAQVVLAAGDVVNVIATGDTAGSVRGVVTFYGVRL
jgi:hypothetical protein